MKYTINKTNDNVSFDYVIAKEDFNQKYVDAFNAASDEEKKDTNAIFSKVMDEVVGRAYEEVCEKEHVLPAAYPSFNLEEKENEFIAHFSVLVFPKVELKQYTNLGVKQETTSVTNEEIEQEIANALQSKMVQVVSSDETLQNGHVAVFDFVGTLNGVPFEGGTAENYELEIGSGMFVPGFESQMVGMKRNEVKVLPITFPTNYTPELAGKDVEFKVTLHEIKTNVVPEFNDEFVESLNIEGVKTTNEYRLHTATVINARKAEANYKKYFEEIINKLIELNPVEIKDELLEPQVNTEVEKLEAQVKQFNIPIETYLQFVGMNSIYDFKNQIRTQIANNIKSRLIFDAIVERENITLSDQDYDFFYLQLSQQEGKPVEEIEKTYPRNQVKGDFLLHKAVAFVLQNNNQF